MAHAERLCDRLAIIAGGKRRFEGTVDDARAMLPQRGPYMHDGALPTLAAVIDLYDRGGIARPSRAVEIRPLGLSDDDKRDLLAFLATLTAAQRPAD